MVFLIRCFTQCPTAEIKPRGKGAVVGSMNTKTVLGLWRTIVFLTRFVFGFGRYSKEKGPVRQGFLHEEWESFMRNAPFIGNRLPSLCLIPPSPSGISIFANLCHCAFDLMLLVQWPSSNVTECLWPLCPTRPSWVSCLCSERFSLLWVNIMIIPVPIIPL